MCYIDIVLYYIGTTVYKSRRVFISVLFIILYFIKCKFDNEYIVYSIWLNGGFYCILVELDITG